MTIVHDTALTSQLSTQSLFSAFEIDLATRLGGSSAAAQGLIARLFLRQPTWFRVSTLWSLPELQLGREAHAVATCSGEQQQELHQEQAQEQPREKQRGRENGQQKGVENRLELVNSTIAELIEVGLVEDLDRGWLPSPKDPDVDGLRDETVCGGEHDVENDVPTALSGRLPFDLDDALTAAADCLRAPELRKLARQLHGHSSSWNSSGAGTRDASLQAIRDAVYGQARLSVMFAGATSCGKQSMQMSKAANVANATSGRRLARTLCAFVLREDAKSIKDTKTYAQPFQGSHQAEAELQQYPRAAGCGKRQPSIRDMLMNTNEDTPRSTICKSTPSYRQQSQNCDEPCCEQQQGQRLGGVCPAVAAIRVRPALQQLLQRCHLLYYQVPCYDNGWPGLLAAFGKRQYVPYVVRPSISALFPTRGALLAYEAALRMREQLERQLARVSPRSRRPSNSDSGETSALENPPLEEVQIGVVDISGRTTVAQQMLVRRHLSLDDGDQHDDLLSKRKRKPSSNGNIIDLTAPRHASSQIQIPSPCKDLTEQIMCLSPSPAQPLISVTTHNRVKDAEPMPNCDEVEEMLCIVARVRDASVCLQHFIAWHASLPTDCNVLPPFLEKRQAGYVLAAAIFDGITLLEQMRLYGVAVVLLQQLIDAPIGHVRKGRWADRLRCDLQHLGRKDDALAVCERALQCFQLSGAEQTGFRRHIRRLSRNRNRERAALRVKCTATPLFLADDGSDDDFIDLQGQEAQDIATSTCAAKLDADDTIERENSSVSTAPLAIGLAQAVAVHTVVARPLNHTAGCKSRYVGWDADNADDEAHSAHTALSVEQLVLQHFASESQGSWAGVHCEGAPVRALFTIMLWEELFADVQHAFQTPFQDAPLDLDAEGGTFMQARSDAIEVRLHDISNMGCVELGKVVDEVFARHCGTVVRGVNWSRGARFYQVCAMCIGGLVLATCFRKLALEYNGSCAGLPDLLLLRRRARVAQPASSGCQSSVAAWDECNDRVMLQSLLEGSHALDGSSCDANCVDAAAHGNNVDSDRPQDTDSRTDMGECADAGDDTSGSFVCPVAEAVSNPDLEWQAKFVEVKGASDSLSDKQIVWLNTIATTMSASAAICHVVGTEKEQEKKKKKKKEKEKKEKKK
eukprot:g1056.t1